MTLRFLQRYRRLSLISNNTSIRFRLGLTEGSFRETGAMALRTSGSMLFALTHYRHARLLDLSRCAAHVFACTGIKIRR